MIKVKDHNEKCYLMGFKAQINNDHRIVKELNTETASLLLYELFDYNYSNEQFERGTIQISIPERLKIDHQNEDVPKIPGVHDFLFEYKKNKLIKAQEYLKCIEDNNQLL